MEMGFNDIAKQCLLAYGYDYNAPVEERFLDFDFTMASYCASQSRVELYIQDNKNTKEFLEKNPHFRYPGGSHNNVSPCWGKNRTYSTNGRC